MSKKLALITGVSGQDGSYLAEFLLEKGYQVVGLERPKASMEAPNLRAVRSNPDFKLVFADLLEHERLQSILRQHEPDEIYNLAAQSFVPVSWELPLYTVEVDALGPLRILEVMRHHLPDARLYQASSSEIFGKVCETPQRETSYHYPRSPYACAKSFGMNITRNYRESFGLYGANGICFNHESERRGPEFVTRKVTRGVAAIHHGHQDRLRIGNLDARRDWGYAPDYVRAMWMILNAPKADDWVVATGESHSIREFIAAAFLEIDVRIEWSGHGIHEVGRNAANGNVLVEIDIALFRPSEVDVLQGDASKIRNELGWEPEVSFERMVQRMVRHDLEDASRARRTVVV